MQIATHRQHFFGFSDQRLLEYRFDIISSSNSDRKRQFESELKNKIKYKRYLFGEIHFAFFETGGWRDVAISSLSPPTRGVRDYLRPSRSLQIFKYELHSSSSRSCIPHGSWPLPQALPPDSVP